MLESDAPTEPAGWARVAFAGAVVAVTTVAVLPRLTPVGNGDIGSFASVAARLRAGDRLYVDVWDNKDPFFYYALALVSHVGPWGYYLLEVAWLSISVIALAQIGRSTGMSRGWSLVAAWGIAPWCIVGSIYIGTLTTMPGVAVVLVVLALAASGRWTLAGAALGVLVLLKLIFVPIALAGLAAFWSTPHVPSLLRLTAGGAASTAGGMMILALRGELGAYVGALASNASYAERMVDAGGVPGFAEHLGRVFPEDGSGARVAIAVITVGVAVGTWRTRRGGRRLVERPLLVCAASVTVASVVVLGLTGVWPHHAQLLALPGALTLMSLLPTDPPRDPGRAFGLVSVALVTAWALGGCTPPADLTIRPARAAGPLNVLSGESQEAASIVGLDVSSFARLGRNDHEAHARGLDDLELACRDFQQYEFDPPSTYERTLRCLPESDVVFVSRTFADMPVAVYLDFTTRAERLLREMFTCEVREYGRLCLRRDQ